MKITAPETSPPIDLEAEAFITGGIYITRQDYMRGAYHDPYLYVIQPDSMLVRLSSGDTSYEDPLRKDWMDVTDKFELMHSDYV